MLSALKLLIKHRCLIWTHKALLIPTQPQPCWTSYRSSHIVHFLQSPGLRNAVPSAWITWFFSLWSFPPPKHRPGNLWTSVLWNPGSKVTLNFSKSSLHWYSPSACDWECQTYGFSFLVCLVSPCTCHHTCFLACQCVWSRRHREDWSGVSSALSGKATQGGPEVVGLPDSCRPPNTHRSMSSWSACGLGRMGLGWRLGIKAALIAAAVIQGEPGPPGSPRTLWPHSCISWIFLNYS